MKLTKTHKEAFIRAVLADLPEVDYRAVAHKLLQDFAYSKMPKEAQAVFDNKDIRHYLVGNSWHLSYVGYIAYVGLSANNSESNGVEKEQLITNLKAVEAQAEEQFKNKERIEEKLRAVIAGCNTLKSALARLPEFEKYLPKEIEGTQSVPAITDLVVSLASLGWPKAQKSAALATA